jgi:hypothetical protein
MTSPLISEALMEATWMRVAGSNPADALRLQKACGKEQEEIMGFVAGFSSDLRQEAGELVFYLHVVISEAFRRSGAKFKPVKPGMIMRTWASAEATVASLKEHGRSGALQHAPFTSEPAVFRYVVEALTEEVEGDEITLTDDEFWRIVSIMMTVSDCLHDAQRGR